MTTQERFADIAAVALNALIDSESKRGEYLDEIRSLALAGAGETDARPPMMGMMEHMRAIRKEAA